MFYIGLSVRAYEGSQHSQGFIVVHHGRRPSPTDASHH